MQESGSISQKEVVAGEVKMLPPLRGSTGEKKKKRKKKNTTTLKQTISRSTLSEHTQLKLQN